MGYTILGVNAIFSKGLRVLFVDNVRQTLPVGKQSLGLSVGRLYKLSKKSGW